MNNIDLSKCPRCCVKNSIKDDACEVCALKLGYKHWFLFVKGGVLSWYPNEKICYYVKNNQCSTLPWLPFNVDEETLNKYLVLA